MKKLTLALVLVAVACLAFGASAHFDTAADATAITAEAAPVCSNAETMPFVPIDFMFTPNYCGDPCSVQGAQIGCIDQGSNPWRRTICTCWNGYLTC